MNYHTIKTRAEAVRDKLDDLIQENLSEDSNIGKCINELAQSGKKLYDALFNGQPGENDANEVQDWLNQTEEPLRFNFVLECPVHIPWGLIFDGDMESLENNPTNSNIDKYRGFWCIKYKVSTGFEYSKPMPSWDIPRDCIKLLPVFQQKVYEQTYALSEKEKNQMIKIFSDFSDHSEPVFFSKDFYDRWKEISKKNVLLYFCCHALQTHLDLTDTVPDTIEANDFSVEAGKILKENKNKICFAFLNGCFTSVGEEAGSFYEATSRQGFYGFIGTESKVPDIFAIHFGLEFLISFLYNEKKLHEIMYDLRKKHWPLGLVYGIYCHPDLRVIRP